MLVGNNLILFGSNVSERLRTSKKFLAVAICHHFTNLPTASSKSLIRPSGSGWAVMA